EGPGAAQPVRAALGGDRHQVAVRAGDEGGRPRPVDVPEQDVHGRLPTSVRTADTTASGAIPARHGWLGTGHSRARLPRQAAVASPSRTVGTRCGAHCPKGTVGAKRLTTGVPTAAATCAGPVLPTTTHAARRTSAASSAREVCPPRSTAPARETFAVSGRSSGPPVTSTG